MKSILNKIGNIMKIIYGYGIMICLFAGALTFFGYLVAFFIGGETATNICVIIYKNIIPVIVYVSGIIVLLGMITMYILGETSLSIKNGK